MEYNIISHNPLQLPDNWIKEAISKDHIKYYEYNYFSNFQEVGRGGFGIVYRANWKKLNKYFALKSFNSNMVTIEEIAHEVNMIQNFTLT